MNSAQIVEELERQKASIETAIAALNGVRPKTRRSQTSAWSRMPLSKRKRILAAAKKRRRELKKAKAKS